MKMIVTEREKATEIREGLFVFLSEDRNGRPTLEAWRGKAFKSFANYYFKDEERRELYLQQLIHDHEKMIQYKARRKVEQKLEKSVTPEVMSKIPVGTILSNSWGYEQTNVDFYQVVAVKNKSVVIRRIASSMVEDCGPMSGRATAVSDSFIGEEIVKRVQAYRGTPYISMKHGSCSIWTGRPMYVSWYA